LICREKDRDKVHTLAATHLRELRRSMRSGLNCKKESRKGETGVAGGFCGNGGNQGNYGGGDTLREKSSRGGWWEYLWASQKKGRVKKIEGRGRTGTQR